ncbi:MAG: DUF1874 domain-containing protein [Tepidimonas sp.]|uniref:STIV orfB116 family protein n=1 Tax=Tepidimonas sp. TaxID=2002775 RepID=UPI00298EDD18|nr:DUF1874 domain-containing protein [Tepidimonas sp.]MDW8336745.1 DUF1874 domain-containing protein [Tepidimonas sp.]
MTHYLLNSPIITDFGHWHYHGPADLQHARAWLSQAPFVSAIGHAATARHLSRLLGIEIPCARVAIHMQPGDQALVFRLLTRLPEGQVLDEATLAAVPYSLGWLERLA